MKVCNLGPLSTTNNSSMPIVPPLKDPEHQVATPAEERSDETPQEEHWAKLAKARSCDKEAQRFVRFVRRIPYK